MNIELIAYFLSGTVMTTVIGKLWDYFCKEREALLRKKELYFSHKIKAAESTISVASNTLSNIKGLRLCHQNFGVGLIEGSNPSYEFLMESLKIFSQSITMINPSASIELHKIALYTDATEAEYGKIDETILPFIEGIENLRRFNELFQAELPSDVKELERKVHELFSYLDSFLSTCDKVEKYLISEIKKLRKMFVKYD